MSLTRGGGVVVVVGDGFEGAVWGLALLEVVLAEEFGGGGARGREEVVVAREGTEAGSEDEGDFEGDEEEVEEGGSDQELNRSLSG